MIYVCVCESGRRYANVFVSSHLAHLPSKEFEICARQSTAFNSNTLISRKREKESVSVSVSEKETKLKQAGRKAKILMRI